MTTRWVSYTSLILALLAGIILSQAYYDAARARIPETRIPLSPGFYRAVDLGLHGALASYRWLFETRRNLIGLLFLRGETLKTRYAEYLEDLKLINAIDPRLAAPYVFSTIALPLTRHPDRIRDAIAIGSRGATEADPDWQMPFYVAVAYHVNLKDKANAAKYFDLAARTPGVPEVTRRFSVNYGIYPTEREQTKGIWQTIYDTATDDETKVRAQEYLLHFEIFDFLDRAVWEYKQKFGNPPKALSDLVESGITPEIPRDPFGVQFTIGEDGVVDILRK